jgi:adenylate cyclase
VGIAQGCATLGAIGFEGRWDYGAIGTVTNVAHRLCAEAAPGRTLVSTPVVADLDGIVDVEAVGDLFLKGLSRPVPAFNVRGLRDQTRDNTC